MATVDPRDEPRGVEAARRVLIEVWTLLAEHRDSLTLVGGSAPPLLVPDDAAASYAGTLDVDVVVDPLGIPDDVYRTIADNLRSHAYHQVDGQHPYRWHRDVEVEGQVVVVELDLLAPVTESTRASHRHEVIEGTKLARRTRGAELVRESSEAHRVEGGLPDGRSNVVTVEVALPGALVVLKALALTGRDKPKDAYDIDFLLAHVPGGIDRVATEVMGFGDAAPVQEALAALTEKYATEDSFGPQSVAMYIRAEVGTEQAARVQALAFARVQALLDKVKPAEAQER